MELIMLGLLMLKEHTIYEIKKILERNFSSMCSNSAGSIQSTVKKMFKDGMIVYNEYVENSVNKKMYAITDKGKEYFINSISEPMLYKEKNMELGKLFFMGFAPKDKRIELINSYISELEAEKERLEKIRSTSQDTEAVIEKHIVYLKESGKLDAFKEILRSDSVAEGLQDIALFQFATLELALDKADFEIRWFEKLKQRLESEHE
jgi:DNA-binding PadR family transcriptional regulator